MSASTARETPLAEVHESLGATFTQFAGWRMPVHYSGHLSEHAAVRTAAGLFDLSHMGEFEVTGPDAVAFLNHALVLDSSTMPVGRARYTLLCSPAGGVLDDLVVYHTGPDTFLIIANAGNADVVAAELAARVAGFDATVTDRSADTALIAVQGPRAADILGPLSSADIAALRYYRCVPAEIAGIAALLARTGYTGEIGYEIYVPPADAPAVWRAVQRAGEPAGLLPAGLAARDTLRLEAGMPLHGHEMSADVSPIQAGLDWVVPADKTDDFVGRAALAEIAAAGTPTVLVGLAGTGRRAARAGYPVQSPDGAVIGEVTSGALSPTLGHPIAMAYVPRAQAEPGTELAVDIRGTATPMRVVPMPFYTRPKPAPKSS